jgi:hypothetical protein
MLMPLREPEEKIDFCVFFQKALAVLIKICYNVVKYPAQVTSGGVTA